MIFLSQGHNVPQIPPDTGLQPFFEEGQLLRGKRKRLKLTQEQIEEQSNLSQPTVSELERGVRSIRSLTAERALQYLGVLQFSQSEISRNFSLPSASDPMEHLRASPDWMKLQRIGVVNAGNSDMYELAPIGEYDEVPESQLIRKQCKLENCYTYLVNGDSMVSDGAKIHKKAIAHGDIIVIERYRTIQKDDLVVFWDRQEQKMLVKSVSEGTDDGYMVFRSFNSSFPPIVRHESDVKIYGVVVWRGG